MSSFAERMHEIAKKYNQEKAARDKFVEEQVKKILEEIEEKANRGLFQYLVGFKPEVKGEICEQIQKVLTTPGYGLRVTIRSEIFCNTPCYNMIFGW